MDRRRAGALVVLAALAAAAFFGWRGKYGRPNDPAKPYVFINETRDARFDESIRMSIVAAQRRTGVQNAVVITDQIGRAEKPELFASELFRTLDVGRATGGKGILYLFSPAQKLLKIEVSYALEGVLPDLLVGGLERAAKTFAYSDRYQDFWAELINTLNIEIARQQEGGPVVVPKDLEFAFLSGGAGITALNYASPEQLATELKSQKLAIPKGERSVDETVALYLASIAKGLAETDSDLLSRESLLSRRLIPLTSFQLYRNWTMYRRANRDRTFQFENLAFVFYSPDQPVLPIVLVRQQGTWRVQEPMAWALFQRFEDSMRVFRKFEITGGTPEFRAYLEKQFGNALYPKDVTGALGKLAADQPEPNSPRELYFRLFAIDQVAAKFEGKAEALKNSDLFLLADSESMLGRFSQFLRVYRIAAARYPNDETLRKNLRFYEGLPVLDDAKWQLTREPPRRTNADSY